MPPPPAPPAPPAPKAARSLVHQCALAIATGFGIGLLPRAPGTFGSLLGLPLAFVLHKWCLGRDGALGPILAVAALTLASAFAWWAIKNAEQFFASHDDQRIVVDEIVGQAVAATFLPTTLWAYLAAFVLFRLLDITKPSLIGRIDRTAKGSLGTLADDLVAGIAAAGILALMPWPPSN